MAAIAAISVILLGVCALVYTPHSSRGWTLAWGLAAVTLTLLLGVPPTLIYVAASLTAVTFLLRNWRVSRPIYALTAVAAVACVLSPYFSWRVSRGREIAALQKEYPIVSLRDRLAYEERGGRRRISEEVRFALPDSHPKLARTIVETEDRLEGSLWANHEMRGRRDSARALMDTHHGFVLEFVRSDDFGVVRSRQMPLRRKYLELPEPQPVLACVPPDYETTSLEALSEHTPEPPPLAEFHTRSVVNFANAPGLGYADSLDEVVAFQPHGFRFAPQWPEHSGRTLQVMHVQLVSLLKHDTPLVYVSENLPRMAELSSATAPTRPLDDFEVESLRKLRDGRELVVDDHPDHIRMFGAIRSLRQCTTCHETTQRGELLGAFSYLFRDVRLAAAAP